jgi:hypothetical protein
MAGGWDVVKLLGGVIVGFLLSQGVNFFDWRRRMKAHWAALDAEIDIAERFATEYRTAGIKAPLYRLPTLALETALPALLREGVMTGTQVDSIESYALLVQDINRGLDLATQYRSDDGTLLQEEYERLLKKCAHLLEPHAGRVAYIAAARGAVRAHFQRKN